MIQPVFFLYCLELVQKAKQKKRLWHAVPALVFTAALREHKGSAEPIPLPHSHRTVHLFTTAPRGRKGSAQPIPLPPSQPTSMLRRERDIHSSFIYRGPAGAQGSAQPIPLSWTPKKRFHADARHHAWKRRHYVNVVLLWVIIPLRYLQHPPIGPPMCIPRQVTRKRP